VEGEDGELGSSSIEDWGRRVRRVPADEERRARVRVGGTWKEGEEKEGSRTSSRSFSSYGVSPASYLLKLAFQLEVLADLARPLPLLDVTLTASFPCEKGGWEEVGESKKSTERTEVGRRGAVTSSSCEGERVRFRTRTALRCRIRRCLEGSVNTRSALRTKTTTGEIPGTSESMQRSKGSLVAYLVPCPLALIVIIPPHRKPRRLRAVGPGEDHP
jgi:hypothetical protein